MSGKRRRITSGKARKRARPNIHSEILNEWAAKDDARYSAQVSTSFRRRHDTVPSLSLICIQTVADYIKVLGNPANRSFRHFYTLPLHVISVLQKRLVDTSASDLNEELVKVIFLNPHSVSISLAGLQWVSSRTINALIQRISTTESSMIRHLCLNGQTTLTDTLLARLMKQLPLLEKVELKGCIKCSDVTMLAMADLCSESLTHLNISYTTVTRDALAVLIGKCTKLQVLKMVLMHLGDPEFDHILRQAFCVASRSKDSDLLTARNTILEKGYELPLHRLTNWKIRGCRVGTSSVERWLRYCEPALERLDLCSTRVHKLEPILNYLCRQLPETDSLHAKPYTSTLQKLNISSCELSQEDATSLWKRLGGIADSQFHTLNSGRVYFGAMKVELNDHILRDNLTSIGLLNLRSLSLWGNVAVGRCGAMEPHGTDRQKALHTALRHLRGTLVRLNLGHTSVDVFDLTGLALKPEADDIMPQLDFIFDDPEMFIVNHVLEDLDLSGTNVNDDIHRLFQYLPNLRRLNLSGTRVTELTVMTAIRECPLLTSFDLTSCRGIDVRDRRHAFEKWG